MAKLTSEEYDRLYEQFKAECSEIAEACEEEFGYGTGSNYELRKEQIMESDYYWPLFHEDEEDDDEEQEKRSGKDVAWVIWSETKQAAVEVETLRKLTEEEIESELC